MTTVLTPARRFWRLLQPYRKQIYKIYLYAILTGLVNLSLPLGIQAIINFIQTGEITTSWLILVGFVLAGIATTGVFQIFQLRLVEDIQQEIFARSSLEFAYRIPKIKLLRLDKIHAPDLINRFFDTLTIQKGLPKILIDLSLALFQIIFGLLLLAVYSPYFIALGILLVFLLWLLFQFTAPAGLKTSLVESKYKYNIAHWLEEVGRNNKSFKLSAYSGLHLQKTDELTVKYLKSRENHFGVLLNQFRFFILFKVIVAAGLLILGGLLVINNQMNIGQFVASEIIIILIISSVEKLIRIIDTIYDVLTALEKIGYVSDMELDEEGEADFIFKDEKGISVEVSHLSFAFPGMRQNILKDLSFSIPAKEKVILKGASGSGKSTLLRLMMGLYEFDEGGIYYNDIPIDNLNNKSLYSKVGFYLPVNELFEASILENICVGREVDESYLAEIIQLLNLKDFLAIQPKGINSIVDPGGRRLPRAVIQKILIARAIIHKPELLIMEEPLLSIPEEDKKNIIEYIMSPERDWTTVIVGEHPLWEKNSTQIIHL